MNANSNPLNHTYPLIKVLKMIKIMFLISVCSSNKPMIFINKLMRLFKQLLNEVHLPFSLWNQFSLVDNLFL